MDIRPLAERDMALVIALSYRIWPVAYAGVLTEAQIANILGSIYTPENLAAEMAAGHRFWAASENGKALGYGSGYRDGDAVWIKKLYVVPEAQGRGVGRALIDTIAAAFADMGGPARELRLLVNNGNRAAQAAYERLGFVKSAEVPVTMGDYAFTDYLYVRQIR